MMKILLEEEMVIYVVLFECWHLF